MAATAQDYSKMKLFLSTAPTVTVGPRFKTCPGPNQILLTFLEAVLMSTFPLTTLEENMLLGVGVFSLMWIFTKTSKKGKRLHKVHYHRVKAGISSKSNVTLNITQCLWSIPKRLVYKTGVAFFCGCWFEGDKRGHVCPLLSPSSYLQAVRLPLAQTG